MGAGRKREKGNWGDSAKRPTPLPSPTREACSEPGPHPRTLSQDTGGGQQVSEREKTPNPQKTTTKWTPRQPSSSAQTNEDIKGLDTTHTHSERAGSRPRQRGLRQQQQRADKRGHKRARQNAHTLRTRWLSATPRRARKTHTTWTKKVSGFNSL